MVLGLTGPCALAQDEIERRVPAASAGVFAIAQLNALGGVGAVTIVGRCDSDLSATLKAAVGRGDVFLFAPAESAEEAFAAECALYHRVGYRPDLVHPVAPHGAASACPICAPRAARDLIAEANAAEYIPVEPASGEAIRLPAAVHIEPHHAPATVHLAAPLPPVGAPAVPAVAAGAGD